MSSHSAGKHAIAETKQSPHVAIILVNYKGASDTLACVASLEQLAYPDFSIWVVENGSEDSSEALLREQLPGHVHLIVSPDNKGFSGGNNLAIQEILKQESLNPDQPKTAYIWLLNNDTTVEPHALSYLVEDGQKSGGIVGSLLLYPDHQYQQVGTVFQWLTGSSRGVSQEQLKEGMTVDSVSGASMLIPESALRRVGLMDESYFLYFEDGDYCLRARQKNYPVTVCLRSRIYHKEGASTGRKSLATQYYFHRNRTRLFLKLANPLQQVSIILYLGFRLLRSSVKALLSKDPQKQLSNHIIWLAARDALSGIEGRCPYNLSHDNYPAPQHGAPA
ncbi:MAG: glycosyltransferase family 2 protein [Cyanobacteria bacterium]|nr:glycosyltransferase family 2 protein [Cyanobacteriota bacterium]